MAVFAPIPAQTSRRPAQGRVKRPAKPVATRGGRDARSQVHAVLHGHPVQAELKVSRPEDPLEREAERVAEEVTREGATPTLRSPPPISRLPPAANDAGDASAEPNLSARLEGLADRGRPLPAPLRLEMEQRFGHDFRGVRIHTGGEAAELADRFRARAFTWRHHVVFGAGAWQPETPAGRRLLAHELTHVVQQQAAGPAITVQRWYIPGLSEVVDAIGDLVDAAGNFIAEQGWKLVRRYAPGLEPILRQGPFNWLKQKVAGAFRSLTAVFDRLNPVPYLRGLIDTFGGLLERAGRIVRALISGDCQPLFTALRELRQFVTEVAGRAWDGLVDFLRPVEAFFTDLWNGFGAPAVEWLRRFAGDLWSDLEQLGRDIWAWLRPLREKIAAAWNWVRDKLFGSDERSGEGDSEGGILGWIRRKAGEVWDWIKASTRPIWEPVRDAAAWIAELLPPAFVREMGESMQSLGQELQRTGDNLREGDGVAENRQTLAEVLPSIDQVLQFVRRLLVSAGQWLGGKVGALGNGVRRILRWLRSSSLLAFLAGLLDWLGSAATDLENWARNTVAGIFGWLVQGFDVLTPFLRRVLATVRRLITVVTDLLQLPLLVAQALWRRIPACIRDPIEDFLINQILRRIPVFGQLLAVRELWQRVQAFAMRILRQVFVDGDLLGAVRTFFSTMLRLIGLPPELVVAVLAKAATAMGEILTRPIPFLINLLKAMKSGFIRFFDNFRQHMVGGIGNWLAGQLSEAGISPPADFSLRSVFAFVLQVLDITMERILSRLAERIGRDRVERLRRMAEMATGVWGWFRTLMTEGPAALWRFLRERISGLWNRVVSSIVTWLSVQIIDRVSKKLLMMLDPSGIMAVVNSLVALYRAIQSFMQYLREMLGIVNRVLDGVLDIARGAIGTAAGYLESALASAIPVAIGFLANQLNLNRLGRRIGEMVEGIRARVDRAIDWLIDRAIRAGQAFMRLVRRGISAVGRGIGRVRAWWRAERRFTTESGESHRLYVEKQGRQVRLMMASEPKPYQDYIRRLKVPADREDQRKAALAVAADLDKALAEAAVAPEAQAGTEADGDQSAQIPLLMEKLGDMTAKLFPPDMSRSTIPEYGPTYKGFGTSVHVERLTDKAPDGASIGTKGGEPTVTNAAWDTLRRLNVAGSSNSQGDRFYVRGHLLNDNLGGPGNTWLNLTPLTQVANNRGGPDVSHLRGFEEPVKQAVLVDRKKVNFTVTARYGRPLRSAEIARLEDTENATPEDRLIAEILRHEPLVPTALECKAKEVDGDWAKRFTVRNVDRQGRDVSAIPVEEFRIAGAQPRELVYLSSLAVSELAGLKGLDEKKAKRLTSSGKETFRTWEMVYRIAQGIPEGARVNKEVVDAFRKTVQSTPGKRVRLYKR